MSAYYRLTQEYRIQRFFSLKYMKEEGGYSMKNSHLLWKKDSDNKI